MWVMAQREYPRVTPDIHLGIGIGQKCQILQNKKYMNIFIYMYTYATIKLLKCYFSSVLILSPVKGRCFPKSFQPLQSVNIYTKEEKQPEFLPKISRKSKGQEKSLEKERENESYYPSQVSTGHRTRGDGWARPAAQLLRGVCLKYI